MKKYEDFEIVVEKVTGFDICSVNVRQPCDGEFGDASGGFELGEINAPLQNPGAANAAEPSETRQMSVVEEDDKENRQLTFSLTKPLTEEMAEEFGLRLKNALFKPEIAVLWGRCKEFSEGRNSNLRIRIDLTAAPELASLPWEYLRLPGTGDFVGLNLDTALVRYLRTSEGVQPLRVIPPVRILLAVSLPEEAQQLNTTAEVENIKNSLAALDESNAKIVVLERATIENLTSALEEAVQNDEPFHVLHFIGHGVFDREKKEGFLLFEGSERKGVAVGHKRLGRLLKAFRSDLRLVILNACEGARLSVSDSYSSVAAKLLQFSQIPAVIAMQFSITDQAAIVFAQSFYAHLAAGENLEAAVDAARLAVSGIDDERTEWATPVFYLRAKDGRLFDVKIPAGREDLVWHYDEVKALLPTSGLVIFLGMEVNLLNRRRYESWGPEKGLPTTAELCAYLSKDLKITPPRDSLARLAKQLQVNRTFSRARFSKFFSLRDKPSKLYQVLAQITRKITQNLPADITDPCHCRVLFVTTTYDFALETAFKEAGIIEYDTVSYAENDEEEWLFSHKRYKNGQLQTTTPLAAPNTPNKYEGLRSRIPVILKLPGEVAEKDGADSSFAITEDDFFKFAIIFDQFEDLFSHTEFLYGENSFGEQFPKAANKKGLPVNFMLSMRDDTLAKLDFFKGKIPHLMKNILRLSPLDREATKDAICQPLTKLKEKTGVEFTIEEDLVEKLLDDLQIDKIKFDTQGQAKQGAGPAGADVSAKPDDRYQVETPYLQLVMVKLWENAETQQNKHLSLDTLTRGLGDVQTIVENYLNEVMNQLSDPEKELVSKFIHYTVTRSGTKVPLNANDIVDLGELPNHKEDIERILRRLSTGSNHVFKSVPNRAEPENRFYEIAHDALGPAILSWRKRENEARARKLAIHEAEQKRLREVAELEAKRLADLEKERLQKAEQEAQLKEEQEKLRIQERLLFVEQRSRKRGRLVWVAFSLLALVLPALIYFYIRREYIEHINKKREREVSLELDLKKAETQESIEQKNEEAITKYYEEQINNYKSLIDILRGLQSGKPDAVRIELNRLREKASDGSLPAEYKPLIVATVKSSKVNPRDAILRDETIAAVEGAKVKADKPALSSPTIIFIQIQNPDPRAQKVKALLESNGYIIPSIENVGEIPSIKQIQLRYFRNSEAGLAGEICAFLRGHGVDAVPTPIGGYENSNLVRQKQFELWFTGDSIPELR